MPLNFPANPTLNQTYTYNGVVYTFNGNLWTKGSTVSSGGSGATVTVANTAPSSPTEGALWIDSDYGDLNVYFSGAWAIIGGGGAANFENLVANVKTAGTITATKPFFLGGTTISEDTTIPSNFNAVTPGPVTVANNITITVPDGSTWTVV